MDPATPLVLTREQHALIGELVEIIGLTEYILARTAERFDRASAVNIRKSTGGEGGNIWAKAIKNKVADAALVNLISKVKKEIEDFAKERNDFVHSLFTGNYASAGYASPGWQTTSAKRS